MDYISVLYYGIIQGLTEFLPVSSSGHLALLPKLLKINDPGVVFDLAMHLGTALSIIVYFRSELISILKSCLNLLKRNSPVTDKTYFTLNLMIATFVTFVFVMLGKNIAFEYGRTTNFIALNLIFFGIFIWIADHRGVKTETVHMSNTIDYKRAALIGLFQSIAIFPGVSRSGATLTISRVLGLSREESAHFSFLLSLPIIIGGLIFKLPEFINGSVSFDLGLCLFGIIISFIVGLITIHYFLIFIKKMGLWVFSIYRVLLGIVLIYIYY
jgi:undecaprenyl-diphosphatase